MKKKIKSKLNKAKYKTLYDRIHADRDHFVSIHKTFMNQMDKSMKRHAYVESYLLAWTFIEQILLPSLIRQIAHDIKFKEVPNLDHFSFHVINYYYFLSHDNILYKKLCEGNSRRTKIIHGLKTSEDIASVNKQARVETKFILKQICLPILLRLKGDTPIPMLSLYSKGWEACKIQILKELAHSFK